MKSSASRAARSKIEEGLILNFEAFLRELEDGMRDLARREAAGYMTAAITDGRDFLDSLKADLPLWTKQLASGQLSLPDFEFLVKGKKDLAKMVALTQAGFAAIRIERLRVALIDLIINAAGKLV